jgi:hypothetical protein
LSQNDPVQRRRAAGSSAPRVHNEMPHLRRARDAVQPSAATGCYALALRLFASCPSKASIRLYCNASQDAIGRDRSLHWQIGAVPLLHSTEPDDASGPPVEHEMAQEFAPSGPRANASGFGASVHADRQPSPNSAKTMAMTRMISTSVVKHAHNAAVQRPRAAVSSAQQAHNEMARLLRASDRVSRSAATACYAALDPTPFL